MTSDGAHEPFSTIDASTANEKLSVGQLEVIDVRMPFDYAGAHIPGSLNLPNKAIRFRKGEVPADKELLFVSEDGKRSVEVCRLAAELGFKDIFNLEGGFSAWTAAGYEVETI